MVLYEEKQINTLREKCDHAVKRIWIASPFIGCLSDVQKIIGGEWKLPSVDCRILTDVEAGFIREDTFEEFLKNQVAVRSLLSLHSKIYIVDDWCLVTSANLTGTAFFCRYEMGISTDDFKDVEATFLKWWKSGHPVNALPKKRNKSLEDYQDGGRFNRKFKAPAKQDKYVAACKKYWDFANTYKNLTGRNQKMVEDGFTILQEVDYLFNYLFHNHPKISTKGMSTPRKLSPHKREQEILKYFKDMCKAYTHDSSKNRIHKSEIIQTLLSPQRIDSLSWKDARTVVECFHCLSKRTYYRDDFVNPNYNKLSVIKDCWKTLLHTGPISKEKIDRTVRSLYSFGYSSAQELIGWYYPEEYPIMNSNSNCGMRFFGYDV